MNEKSLKNLNKITSTEEAKRKGRLGGIKSGEARRKKRTLTEQLKAAMNAPVKNASAKATLEAAGLDPTYGGMLIIKMISSAGKNPAMAKLLMQMVGEDPQLRLAKQELALKKKLAQDKQGHDDTNPVIIVGEEDIPE